jgi:hypothetical protein
LIHAGLSQTSFLNVGIKILYLLGNLLINFPVFLAQACPGCTQNKTYAHRYPDKKKICHAASSITGILLKKIATLPFRPHSL